MVIHCFIDGYSRFVLGICVQDNKRGASVLELLREAVKKHGCPSRTRGDHGVENTEVAIFMEETNGSGRGSFIWGR
jgi:transposase InsO family protein